MSKPTISFSGMTQNVDDVTCYLESPDGMFLTEIDINKIKHAEMSVEFKWELHSVFRPSQLVWIEGHLCRVVAVAKDGSITFERVEELK